MMSQSTMRSMGLVAQTSYAWAITQDNIDDGENVGVCGPRECKLSADEIRKHEKAEKFRVLDDDGEIYWYGYFVDLSDADGFEPLDDYGRSYGCTSIEYKDKETGEYKQL